MKKQLQLFLTGPDELDLSRLLAEARPEIVFVDGNLWGTEQPPIAATITECSSSIVFLWDRAIVKTLPTFKRQDGVIEGPVTGPVIQLVRSRLKGDLLLSGRIAAGLDDTDRLREHDDLEKLVAEVWKLVRKAAPVKVVAVDPASGLPQGSGAAAYRAGRDASRWCGAGGLHFFKDRSTANFFRPTA